MVLVLAATLMLGHVALAVTIINRLHGIGLRRPILKLIDWLWYLFLFGVPLLVGSWYLQITVEGMRRARDLPATLATGYMAICTAAAVCAVLHILVRGLNQQTSAKLISNHTARVNIGELLGHANVATPVTRCFNAIPGNQILDLHIHEKTIQITQLDPRLDGLSITHLSDLHFTGQLKQSFYDQVVGEANQLSSDLIAITGDIIDKPQCFPWITQTLSKLQARYGVFVVLGNHEQRLKNEQKVRSTLTEAGLMDIGSRWQQGDHNGAEFWLAGNERPWFGTAPEMSKVKAEAGSENPLKILLAHTPDLLGWACRQGFDLMLAGHTHGGQVRFPIIGPVLSPSVQGTRFASGVFYHSPTLLHVSRGIAGTRPLRINCPPELTKLVLARD